MKSAYPKKGFGGRKSTYKGEVSGGRKYSGSTWSREDKHDRADRPTLHKATCSQCGAACEVPFKPNGKKPVMCRNCYRPEEGGELSPRKDRRSSDQSKPYAKSYAKPAYGSPATPSNTEVVDQLKTLNMKMDLVLRALAELGKRED